ncbi:MAG: methylated-DNA--[protein]-cysteine S-methyltransferase [Bacteroidales bacterium]|nr:methylated-DNA--[protein]-cysteine S-methyltransferase [Bacteroidales bacterium]
MIKITKIETPLGEMVAGATREGICLLEFADRNDLNEIYDEISKVHSAPVRAGINWQLWKLKKQLREYFNGKRRDFTLNLIASGTDFQKSVWEGLRKIPYGETISYQDQAAGIRNTGAARAVAQANASNRIAIIIPCHRVIGADGSLVGYGGGLARKKWLLDHERKYSGKAVELDLF